MKILPLLKDSDLHSTWRFPNPYQVPCVGDPFGPSCTTSLRLDYQTQVSQFEYNPALRDCASLRNEVERRGMRAIRNRVYPQELIRELREISDEIHQRFGHAYRQYLDVHEITERLGVVITQLAGN